MIVIGTSGYYFTDWSGTFYPQGLPKEKWLNYYAQRFRAVEINRTYYGPPTLKSVERWVAETPDDFTFFVKLHRESTHERRPDGKAIHELLERIEPLISRSRLKGLLAQFPASFHAGDEERSYLAGLREHLGGLKLFVELRHKSWDSESAVELLRELGYGWVAVDQPDLPGLARTRPAVTGDTGYVRFHGRNRKTWYDSTAGDRYDWDYSPEELKNWFPRLKAMAKHAETTYLFFNNCHAGQAIRSAMRMNRMLKNQFEVF